MRVGVIGLSRGRALAQTFRRHPQVEEVFVHDLDPTRMTPDGCLRVGSLPDLLDSSLDLMVIATPPSFHTELALQSVEHGIPVLCETPIVMSDDELKTLTSRATSAAPILMAEDYLWLDWVEQTRQTLSGEIGYCTAHYLEDARSLFRPGDYSKGWRGAFNPFLYQTHLLAPILNLCGDRVVTARGFTGSSVRSDVGVCQAVYETSRGSLITVVTGFSVAYPYGFGIELVGETGTWNLDGASATGSTTVGGNGDWRTSPDDSLSEGGMERRVGKLVAHVVESHQAGQLGDSVLATDWPQWIAPGLAAVRSHSLGGAVVEVGGRR